MRGSHNNAHPRRARPRRSPWRRRSFRSDARSTAHEPTARPMLGLLFGRRASTEERATVRRRCATRETAVKQCLAANDATACDAFGQDLDLCKVRLETHDRSSSRSAPPRALFPAARAPRARRSSSRVVRRSRPPPSIFPRAGPRGVPRRRRRIQPLHPPGHQPHRHESHHAELRRCPSQASRLPSNQARLSVTASDEPRRIASNRDGSTPCGADAAARDPARDDPRVPSA